MDARVATQSEGLVALVQGFGVTGSMLFYGAGAPLGPSCATATVGACTWAADCPQLSPECLAPAESNPQCSDPPGFPCTPPNAGTITFSDETDASYGAVTDDPSGLDGIYPEFQSRPGVFAAGDLLSVTASGGDVPAFSVGLVAPHCPSLLSPPPPDAGSPIGPTYVLPTTQDFTVAWNGGETGATVHLALEGSPQPHHSVEIDCAFDGGAGQGTVPQAVLELLRGAPEGYFGSFVLYQERSTTIHAGSFQVTYAIRDIAEGDPALFPSPCDYNWGRAAFQ